MSSVKQSRWFRWTAIPALAAALVLPSCGGREERKEASPLAPVRVRTESVVAKKRVATEEAVGTVRARLRATIEAKVNGRIIELPVTAGQKVKKGDLAHGR